MKEIVRKCQKCDGKNERSINIDVDDFIAIKNKNTTLYFHTQCYYLHLITKERMSEENALLEIQRIKSVMTKEIEEQLYKDKLCYYIMNNYNISYLPKYFYIRLNEIVKGTYKNTNQPIQYSELYEMYSNQKLIAKLGKIAIKNNIKDMQKRLYWDLAIIISEYDNYKKWKRKHISEDINISDIKTELKKMKNNIKKNENIENEININDLIL